MSSATAVQWVSVLWLSVWGASPLDPADQDAPRQAITRGLAFLQADAIKWRAEHDCATCHHGALSVWAFSEARRQGYPLDAAATADLADWTKTRFFAKLDEPRAEGAGARLVSLANIYLALSATFVPEQDTISQADLDRIAGHLVRHQEADGSWSWSSAPRQNTPPPVFESDETVTLMAWLALQPRTPADTPTTDPPATADMPAADTPTADAVAESAKLAAALLQESPSTGTTQALAFRLLFQVRAGQTGEQLASALDALRGRQQADGGWGQIADAASDAYATGQALYALSLAGVPRDDAAIQRAVAFLLAQQRADGSWPMTSRAHPGATPFTNPIPITYFGSAWATLGLLRTFPAPSSAAEPAAPDDP
jgi:hypothetical protein